MNTVQVAGGTVASLQCRQHRAVVVLTSGSAAGQPGNPSMYCIVNNKAFQI